MNLPPNQTDSSAGNWVARCISTAITELSQKRRNRSAPKAYAVINANKIEYFKIGKSGELLRTARLGRSERRNLGLRLLPDSAVTRRLNLPAGAKEVLPAIIQNKVESMAPWPLSQAVWGYLEMKSPQGTDGISVATAIASRKHLDSLINQIAQDGSRVVGIDVASAVGSGDHVTLQTGLDERRKKTKRSLLILCAIALASTLAVGGYGLQIALSEHANLATLQEKQQELTASLIANGQSETLSPLLLKANSIYERRAQTKPFAAVVNTLSELLPDSVWLNRISYTTSEITISGLGKNVPSLVETLERSTLFQDARFGAATQRDDKTGNDQFTITAKLNQTELSQ
jgi:general secretion pathway protein L